MTALTNCLHEPPRILMHPVLNVPATATFQDWYTEFGFNVGLVLLFADGHLASLTFEEIRKFEAAAVDKAVAEPV
jgi:hypothetical protein